MAHLARELQRLVPGLDINNLNVIVIGSRNPLSPHNPSVAPIRARNACNRENPLSGLVEWQYHVALRYRDLILDLDATDQATLIPLAEYPSYFANRRALDSYGAMAAGLTAAEDLFVTTVPIQEYLRISERDVIRPTIFRPLISEYPQVPLMNIGER